MATEKQIAWQRRAWSKLLLTNMVSSICWILQKQRGSGITNLERTNLISIKAMLTILLNDFQENSKKLGFNVKTKNQDGEKE